MKTVWRAIKAFFHAIYGGPWWKKIIVWAITLILLFFLLLGAVDINLFGLFGRSPGFSEITKPPVTEASIIYSEDGVQLGSYYNENRIPVTFEDISPIVTRMLVNTEDVRFYQHHGVDVPGMFSTLKDIIVGNARGGSTITQQLAKNMFKVRRADGQYSTGKLGKVPGFQILIMKAKEWIVAMKLEMVYSKEEILTMYLNTVDFGSNSFGIKTAASTYFDTTPHELTYEQAATLVGLLKATSYYNPKLHTERSLERRNIVLDNLWKNDQMVINGYPATKRQLDSIKALPIVLTDRPDRRGNLGIVPYFRKALEDYVNMLCERGYIPGYDEDNKIDLYSAGLKLYTTLDTRMQQYAENAAMKQMRIIQRNFKYHWGGTNPWRNERNQEIPNFIENIAKRTSEYKYLNNKYNGDKDSIDKYLNTPHTVTVFTYDGYEDMELSVMDSIRYMVSFMHCGFVVMEPDTRQVKAWVGDIDFKSWEYDKVTSRRQPGSTFKLFVYTEAMNQGLTPCDRRTDSYEAYSVGSRQKWVPHNAGGGFSGASLQLKRAFAISINSVAVKVGKEVGVSNVARTAHAMGIESHLEENLSLCLGSSDVSLLELANAYCTVANDGRYNIPIMITKIEDRNGNIIYEATLENEQVIPYRSAYLMQKMLQGGLTEPGGTSAGMWGYLGFALNSGRISFGGKTGTSNNYSDAWYMGVTPGLVGGAWVGGEYRSIHFRSGALGQGAHTAMPIFAFFMQDLLQDPRYEKYYRTFDEEPREPIDSKCWTCDGFYVSTDPYALQLVNRTENEDSLINAGLTIFTTETIEEAPASTVEESSSPLP